MKREAVVNSFLSLCGDASAISGAAAITFGAWQIFVPAGWIVGGLFGLGVAYALARRVG